MKSATDIPHAGGDDGDSIDHYKLLEHLGEGGFGEVWVAEQHEPVHRMVAVKLLKAGMDSKEVLGRFEAERQALAMMDHPGIAKVFDAGLTRRGRPYFAMEHVPGLSITEYCDSARLTLHDRLVLFQRTCDAVQHAHTKGIIHRDLKPSNILVALLDGSPTPKVIDFGIAKATWTRLTDRTVHTSMGRLMGTPDYMSPEQAGTSGIDVDTRADIYSLGVVLYQLLTGLLPFDPTTLREAGYESMVKILRDVEPPRPSMRLSSWLTGGGQGSGDAARLAASSPHPATTEITKRFGTDLASVGRELRGDLDWIVMKCLEKDRSRRYETVSSLRADIDRHLAHEPVLASPPGRAYRLRKFVRRNRAAVIAASVIGLALATGGGAATYGLIEARVANTALTGALVDVKNERDAKGAALAGEGEQRKRAEANAERAGREARKAEEVNRFLLAMLAAVNPERAQANREVTVREILDGASISVDRGAFAAEPEVEASVRATLGVTYSSLGLYTAAEPHLRMALDIRRRELSNDHPQTLASISDMGLLLLRQGKLKEAEPYLAEAVEGRRRVLGNDDPATLSAIFNMAALLQRLDRIDEAVPLSEEALAGNRRVLGDEHSDTLGAISEWADLLQDRGRVREAESFYLEAFHGCQKMLGNDHPRTLALVGRVAVNRMLQGDWTSAEARFREALDGERRVHGDDHPLTFLAMTALGEGLMMARRLAEAEELLCAALEGQLRSLGAEHADTLRSMSSVGLLRQKQGKYAEAEKHAREALETARPILGDDHRTILGLVQNLGTILRLSGKLAEAEPYCMEALEMARRKHGDDHPTTFLAMQDVAHLLQARGKPAEAEVMFADALARSQRLLGDDHSTSMQLEAGLAGSYSAQGKLADAERMTRAALERHRRVLGEDSTETLTLLNNLSRVLHSQGRYAEAEPYLRAALEGRQRALGENHPETLLTVYNLTALLKAKGDIAEAVEMSRDLLERQRRVLTSEHADVFRTMSNLGDLLRIQGKLDEAESFIRAALEGRRRVLKDDHPETLNTVVNLGGLLHAQGKFDESADCLESSLASWRRIGGNEHPNTLRTLSHLARTRLAQGKLEAAEANAREALAGHKRVFGESNAATLTCLAQVATILEARGQHASAEPFRVERIEAARRRNPIDEPSLAIDLADLGMNRIAQARFADADVVLRECLFMHEQALTEEHPKVWTRYNAQSLLGEAVLGQAQDCAATDMPGAIAKLREAETLLLPAAEWMIKDPRAPLPGQIAGHDPRREAIDRAIRLYETWARVEPAAGRDADAAQWRQASRQTLPPGQ